MGALFIVLYVFGMVLMLGLALTHISRNDDYAYLVIWLVAAGATAWICGWHWWRARQWRREDIAEQVARKLTGV